MLRHGVKMLLRMGLLSHLGPIITLGASCSVFKLQVTDTLSVSPSGDIFWRGHEKSCGAAEKNRGCKSLYSFLEVLTIVSFYVYTAPFYFLLSISGDL